MQSSTRPVSVGHSGAPARLTSVYESAGLTDVGRRRLLNEDAFLVDDHTGVYVVADGMGGHAAGEVASREAVEVVQNMVVRQQQTLQELRRAPAADGELARRALRLMESAVQAATYLVFAMGEHDPAQSGMGTTLSALAIAGHFAITGQVGDSRIYLIRDGIAQQLTEDHTLVAWQVQNGILTAEEAASSPHKNVITRAVGSHDYVEVDTRLVAIEPGDAFLLCSDGLHGYVSADEIGPLAQLSPTAAVRRFVDLANHRGGRDNITALLVKLTRE
ncbi:MAG: PP2C family protein-serine/threonine phosphatase [Polyangiales bacterium]